MTKFLPITALFIAAGVVAAPALMSNHEQIDARQTSAVTSDELTRRGTRAPLMDLADASWQSCGEPATTAADQDPKATEQPRRGSRSEFVLASSDAAPLGMDGSRRGTR
jgi:hypothetical protein